MNIILIVTDQERRFHDLPQGFPFDRELPNRKRLMKMGTSFRNAFCASNPCTPNRGVLYTGKHFQETGIYQNWSDIRPETPTIGNYASQQGYYCAYKGKWHLTTKYSADTRGIDVAKALNSDIDTDMTNTERTNPELWLKPWGFSEWNVKESGDRWGSAQEGNKFDHIYAQESIEWLNENQKQKFMLCINFIQPHDIMYFDAGINESQNDSRIESPFTSYTEKPFMCEPDDPIYRKKFNLLPKTLHSHDSDKDKSNQLPKPAYYYKKISDQIYGKLTTDKEFSRYLDYYLNCLRENDILLGKILDCIEANKYFDRNTIIIFTSDHGEMGGEHGLRQKGSIIYKENIGVPLVFAGTNIPSGIVTDAVVSTVDIAPTILSFMNNRCIYNFVGHDFSKFIMNNCRGDSPRQHSGALFQYVMGIPHRIRPFCQGIITERYSFSRHFTTEDEKYKIPLNIDDLFTDYYVTVYDKLNDPDELVNLANDIERNYNIIDMLNTKLNMLIVAETDKNREKKEFRFLMSRL